MNCTPSTCREPQWTSLTSPDYPSILIIRGFSVATTTLPSASPGWTLQRSEHVPRRHVVCHRDFGGDNLLVAYGHVVAILDWEQAVWVPREHDLWIAAEL